MTDNRVDLILSAIAQLDTLYDLCGTWNDMSLEENEQAIIGFLRDWDQRPRAGAISGSQVNEEHVRQVRKSPRELYKELAERWCRLVFPHLNFDHIQWSDDEDEP